MYTSNIYIYIYIWYISIYMCVCIPRPSFSSIASTLHRKSTEYKIPGAQHIMGEESSCHGIIWFLPLIPRDQAGEMRKLSWVLTLKWIANWEQVYKKYILKTKNVASDRRPMRVFSSKMLKSPLSRTCFHDSLVTSLTAFLLLWQHLRLTVLPCSWNCKSQSSLPKTGRRSFCARLALYAHSYWSFDIVAKHKHRSRTDSLNGRRKNCYGNGRSSGYSLIELESQEETEPRSRRTFTLRMNTVFT